MTKVKKDVANRRSLFPLGHFAGEITAPAGDDASYLQQNDDGSIGNIVFQLTNNAAVEADVEPGARRCFVRIPVWFEAEVTDDRGRTAKQMFQTADVANDENLQEDDAVPFMIRDAVGTFAQLAAALGVAQVTDEGIEDFDIEELIENLKNGTYEGQTVEFKVSHRFSKKAKRTFEQVDFVIPEPSEDDGQGEAPEAATEDAEEAEEVPETEEEEPTPAPARTVTRRGPPPARKPAPAKKPAAAKGSGKGKFTRRK